MASIDKLIALIEQYKSLGIDSQIDYEKFYLYSIITHSTAIEGSTVTEIETSCCLMKASLLRARPSRNR